MKFSHKLVTAASIALLSSSAFGNLLLHYSFDEASAGKTAAVDTGVAPAANGTFGGNSTRTSTTPGGLSIGALDTNGGSTSSYLLAADADKLDGLSQITVTAWINLQASPGQYDRIVSDHSAQTDGNDGWDFFIDKLASDTLTAANFRLGFSVDGTAASLSGLVSADNQWAFVAVTYDGTKTSANLNYFVGGLATSVAGSGTANQNLNAGASDPNSIGVRIGSTARTTSDRTPDAFFDDVRVYDELLSSAQLDAIRMTSVPEPTAIALLTIAAAGLLRRSRP